MSLYWDNSYYEETLTFGIVSSNHNLVAEFSSTTDNALIKLFTNDSESTYNSNIHGFIIGSSNNNNIQSFTIGQVLNSNNSITPTNDFTIYNHNIGINTSFPKYTLDVNGIGHFNSNVYIDGPALVIPVGSTSTRPDPLQGMIRYNTETSSFEGYGPGATWGSLGGVVNTEQTTYIKAELYPTANDNNLRFINANNENMRITNNGLIGIGTSNPLYKLDVNGNAHFSDSVVFDKDINCSSNLYTINTYITSNIIIGQRILSTSNTTSLIIGSQSYPPSVVDGSLQINGDTYITGTLYASRVRYGNAGTIMNIPGTTILTNLEVTNLTCINPINGTIANQSNQGILPDNITELNNLISIGATTNSDLDIYNSNVTISGTLYAAGSVFSTSDKSIKTDFLPILNPLEKINQLTGYTYTRTDTHNIECGLIAQDVQKVLPEVVTENTDKLLSIAYGNMSGLWVEAFKAMQERINTLESKLESLLNK